MQKHCPERIRGAISPPTPCRWKQDWLANGKSDLFCRTQSLSTDPASVEARLGNYGSSCESLIATKSLLPPTQGQWRARQGISPLSYLKIVVSTDAGSVENLLHLQSAREGFPSDLDTPGAAAIWVGIFD